MEIRILGTRGNINIEAPHHRLHSGILIDNKILIDVGEKQYLNYNPGIILITHLHPDHACFISDKSAAPTVPTYAPEAHKSVPDILVTTRPFKFENYQVIPLPVTHSLHVASVGYLIKLKSKSVFCTGDVAGFDTDLLEKFAPLDMIITEASFIKKGGMIRLKDGSPFGHLGVPDLINLFRQFTQKIVFMHFGSWFVKDVHAGTEKIISLETTELKLRIAEDGMNFKI